MEIRGTAGFHGMPPRPALRTVGAQGQGPQEHVPEPDPDYVALTKSDKEFVYSTTGERIEEGRPVPALGQLIAADRRTGVLAPGQPIDGAYLNRMLKKWDGTLEGSPFTAEFLSRATEYLSAHGGKAPIDFTA